MALVAPREGELLMLRYIVSRTAATAPVLHLFTNDLTFDSNADGYSRGTFTAATQAGYTAFTLASLGWTTEFNSGNCRAVYSETTFTFSTIVSVYGYFVTDVTGNTVLWAERFSGAPFNLPTNGGSIAVTPRVELE